MSVKEAIQKIEKEISICERMLQIGEINNDLGHHLYDQIRFLKELQNELIGEKK